MCPKKRSAKLGQEFQSFRSSARKIRGACPWTSTIIFVVVVSIATLFPFPFILVAVGYHQTTGGGVTLLTPSSQTPTEVLLI